MEERKTIKFTIDDAKIERLRNGKRGQVMFPAFMEVFIQVAREHPENHYIGEFDDARKDIDGDEAVEYYNDGREDDLALLIYHRYIKGKGNKQAEQMSLDVDELLKTAISVGDKLNEEQIVTILGDTCFYSLNPQIFQEEDFTKFIEILAQKYETIEKPIFSKDRTRHNWDHGDWENKFYYTPTGVNTDRTLDSCDEIAKVMIGQLLGYYNKGNIHREQITELTMLYFSTKLNEDAYYGGYGNILLPGELRDKLKELEKNDEKPTIDPAVAAGSLARVPGALENVGDVPEPSKKNEERSNGDE